ncbi:hypothetical protein PINS_up003507 [Pythium insidiosum]|nr:hypothetical protein PINS_up003507 [Pythium insidiosum]
MPLWEWSGALLAIVAGERFFGRVQARDGQQQTNVFCVGDGVRVHYQNKVSFAIVTALWESRDGAKQAEVRLMYSQNELIRQLQSAPRGLVPSLVGLRETIKVWESDRLEVVEVSQLINTVTLMGLRDYQSITVSAKDVAVVVGMFNTKADCVEVLPEGTTHRQRSRQISARARHFEVSRMAAVCTRFPNQ